MDRTEQDIIDELFGKLEQAERGDRNRDAGAERHIARLIDRQPAAPYYMAQAIIVQEHALKEAQRRIEELEAELEDAPAQQGAGGGSFLGGIFGGGAQPARGSVPRSGRATPGARYPQQNRGRSEEAPLEQYQRTGRGGGFLSGAASTAMGVAGGLLLGNMLGGMFGGDEAKASEASAGQNNEQNNADNSDNDADHDGGGWFGGGDDMDI
ncbi:MAG: DUF2076 family protein [Hyphomicrobiales bacterium]|nr:DUF2076 family protein [Hyphomicrobiales bacterium]